MNKKTFTKCLLFIAVLFGIIVFANSDVFAVTKSIANKQDYYDNKYINTTKTFKLANDVNLEGLNSGGNEDALSIKADLTIDLNGYRLILPEHTIKLWYYGSHTVTIIDSSVAKTGKIIRQGDREAISLTNISSGASEGNLIIDGISYQNASLNRNAAEIRMWTVTSNKKLNVLIKNSTFDIIQTLFGMNDIDDYSGYYSFKLQNSTVKSIDNSRNVSLFSFNDNLKYKHFIDTNKSVVYGDDILLSNEELLDDSTYKRIDIRDTSRFEVTAPTFDSATEGYSPISEKIIAIKAVAGNRIIKSVSVNSGNFTVTPASNVAVNSGETDSTFNIKPIEGLEVGNYSATIIVTDSDDNTFTDTVSFTVKMEKVVPMATQNKWTDGLTADVNASFSGGTGTGMDPYRIASATDLAQLAINVNSRTSKYNGKYFVMTADIDLAGKYWIPIGNGVTDAANAFKGHFDGANHIVSNMNIKATECNTIHFLGLFAWIYRGSLKNVGMQNAYIDVDTSGTEQVALLLGYADDGVVVDRCFAIGDIDATADSGVEVAGLIGQNYVGSAITNCFYRGTINAPMASKVGGLIAYQRSTNPTNCYVVANLITSGTNKFAIATAATNCYYDSTLNSTITGGAGTAKTMAELKTTDMATTLGDQWEQTSDINKGYPHLKGFATSVYVTTPNFDNAIEGYASVLGKAIKIKAIGANRTIESVTISGSDFEINNPGAQTITAGDTCTEFIVTPKTGLVVGKYAAVVTVTDSDSNTYTENVSFEVTRNPEIPVTIADTSDYISKFIRSEEDSMPYTFKLMADITMGSHETAVFDNDAIIDLNGHSLTMTGTFDYRVKNKDSKIKFIDSSALKTGKLIGTNNMTNASMIRVDMASAIPTIEFDGINIDLGTDYIVSSNAGYNASSDHIVVNVKNSKITHDGDLFGNLGSSANLYNTLYFENTIIEPKTAGELVRITLTSDMRYSNIINPEIQTIKAIPNGTNDEQIIDNLSFLNSVSYKKLMFITNSAFEVTAPTFENVAEDYGTEGSKSISIKARNGARTIKSVAVNSADFIIDGPSGEVLVADGTTNTEFTIKPIDNLPFGSHEATITVTDTNDNTYTTAVVFNVATYAETQIVTTEEQFRKFTGVDIRKHTEVKIVKLGANITLNDWAGIYVLEGKTIDLNGHTLNLNDSVSFVFGTDNYRNIKNANFVIKDSDPEKKGKINSTYNGTMFNVSEQYYGDENCNFSFTIEDGVYNAPEAYYGMFFFDFYYGWKDTDNFKFNIKNGEFNLGNRYDVAFMNIDDDSSKSNFDINLENVIVNTTGDKMCLVNPDTEYTIGDIIPENYRLIYPKMEGNTGVGTQIAPRNLVVDKSIRTCSEIRSIIIEKIQGFEVVAPTFANAKFGYGALPEQGIAITTVGPNRTIKSVVVSDETKFTVSGTGTPTIATDATDNTTYRIKPNTGLGVGTHEATITVTDSIDRTYTDTVTFTVEKADITPTVTINNWTYGETAQTPNVLGNTGSGTVSYHYLGINGTEWDSNSAPTDAGTYRLTASIAATDNYNGGTCNTEFSIDKKIIDVDNDKLIINNKPFDNTTNVDVTYTDAYSEQASEITTTATMNVSYDKYVGAKVGIVTATLSDTAYKNYSFATDAKVHTKTNASFNITALGSTITDVSGGTSEVIKNIGKDLRPFITLNPSEYKGNVTFAIDGTFTGVSLDADGYTLRADNTAAANTSVKINVNFAGKDLNEDSVNEYLAAEQKTIYVKVVNKPTQVFDKTNTTVNMKYADTKENAYIVTTPNGGEITYSSSDDTIVSVDANGKLTAHKASATPVAITVIAAETATHAETRLTYEVNVAKRNVTVSAGTYKVTKIYDGTNAAVAGTGNLVVDGILAADSSTVKVNATPNTFSNSSVHSENRAVNLSLTVDVNYVLTNSTVLVPYSITAKTTTPTVTVSGTYIYTGSEIIPTVVVKDGENTIPVSEYTISYVDNIEVGTATIRVNANEGSNYTWENATETFEIDKANYTGTITAINREVIENKEETYEIGKSEITLPVGFVDTAIVNVAKAGDLIKDVSNTASKVTYTVNSLPKDSTGTLSVTISSKNYNDVTATINVKAIEKTVVTISGLTYASRDYNGQKIVPTGTLTADNDYDISNLEVLYEGVAPTVYSSAIAPAAAGTYKVTYKIPDDDAEFAGKIEYNFTINKANPTYTAPTGLIGIAGKKLSTVTLPSGFSWKDGNIDLIAGVRNYLATFTPSDSENYSVVEDITVTVNVKNEYGISVSSQGNGSITSDKSKAMEGTSAKITFTPNTGFMVDEVKVNGNVINNSLIQNNKLTLTINASTTVDVKYKKIPYTLTINEVTGATIVVNETAQPVWGDERILTITANFGYRLVSVKVNGEAKTLNSNNELYISDIKENKIVNVIVEKIIYKVIEGNNQVHTLNKDEDARFRVNADYSLFNKVYVDGAILGTENYTSESGSTIIILDKEYIDSLAEGNHSLKVTFTDGGEATAQFKIAKKVVTPTTESVKTNPTTGDNIMTYVIVLMVSLIGITTIYILGKRKYKTKK